MTQANAVEIQRTFDAPIDVVWSMWTEAEHFSRWYGPTGATVPSCEMDAAIGGRRHLCMQFETPNGEMQMWLVGTFTEVTKPTRLAYTESMSNEAGDVISPASMGMPDGPDTTVVTVEFEDLGDKTAVTMRHAGVPQDSPGATGWNMALDKLEGLLTA